MSDTHLTDFAWTDCPDCGCGEEHLFYIYGDTPDPIIMRCYCGRVSRHRLDRAMARWEEVEGANYQEHVWHSAD
jgi:hypothetical protein